MFFLSISFKILKKKKYFFLFYTFTLQFFSKWKSGVDEEPSQVSNYFRKRSFSSFTPELSDPVLPNLKPVEMKQFTESESAAEMSANDSNSQSHPVESQNPVDPGEMSTMCGENPDPPNSDIVDLPAKSFLRVCDGPKSETRQPLYDVPRKLNFDTAAVASNSENCEQQDQHHHQIVVRHLTLLL